MLSIAPELLVAAGALVVLFLPGGRGEGPVKRHAAFAAATLVVAGILVLSIDAPPVSALSGMVATDAFARLLRATIAFAAAGIALMSMDWSELPRTTSGEVASLVLFSACGAMFMSATTDFLMFFVALQLSSIPLYALAASREGDPTSSEAAFKFLLLGMTASVVMIYGFSLRFGQVYGTSLRAVVWSGPGQAETTVVLAMALVLLGMLFKLGSAPLHFWIPDTYEGSPTPVGALLATVPKCASVAVFLRAIGYGLMAGPSGWISWLLAILAVVSMTLGNLSALAQTNLKRIFAYSSIAHIGYLMIALSVGVGGSGAAAFYVITYALTNLGAFAVVQAVTGSGSESELSDLRGLSRRSPLLATVLAVMVLSLLGVPPTPGFWAKLLVFLAAIRAGEWWLAVLGIANSLISVAYYIPILRESFSSPAEAPQRLAFGWSWAVGAAALLLSVSVGLFPGWLIEASRVATATLAAR